MAIKTPAELLQDISTYITNKVGKIRRSEHGAVERDIVESLDSLITAEKNARENADSYILSNVGEALTELEEDLVVLIGEKVSGPASSVDNTIPIFNGITGKLLKGQTTFTIEGTELNGGLSGSIKLNNSVYSSMAASIKTGSYNDEDAIKIGRNTTSQHYISFANSTAGGSANWISFKVWNNSSQRNTILTLTSPFNSSVGEATITGKLQVNSGNIIHLAGQMGLGTNSPISGTRLDISDGSLSLNIGANVGLTTRTNATAKTGRITSMHYTNAEEPQLLIQGFSDATTNIVNIGGGTSSANTATGVVIYAAANNTTLTGTEVARFNTTGLGIGTNNPSEKLHVIGNTLVSGDSASATKTIANKVRMEYDTATDTLEFNFI